MTSIFDAFRDYDEAHRAHVVRFSWERDPGPTVVEDRPAVLARIRARYPEVWERDPPPPEVNPYTEIDRLAERTRETLRFVIASDALLARYGLKRPPPHPRPPDPDQEHR